jgi:uncharacterized glyoxalase superfamily protein PhnB
MAGASLSAAEGRRLDRRPRKPSPLRSALDSVYLDVVVDNLEAALSRALAAGAQAETKIRTEAWGKIVVLAIPSATASV